MGNIEVVSKLMEIAGNLSVVGLLFGLVWAFFTGKLIPKNMLDSMMREADNRTAKLVKEILVALRGEVRDGVRDAMDERERG